ncbi:MAG: esterase family protein [Oscillospiraceae bacterium]|nr:esterase family protein [Oscillospiraceae bacterium]
MKKFRQIAALCTSILLLTACSRNADTPQSGAVSVSESEPASSDDEQTISKPETEDISYMKKYKDLIEEMPRDGITEKSDGIIYPEFQRLTYYSKTAERDTPVNVLLPPDYSEEKTYPVLYILHGYYDNEKWMARDIVGISAMLANLCRSGEAEEMIVVLPYIYCSKDMPYCTGMDLQNSLNYDNFINDLTTDLMPFIERSFSVAPGRENTAITGFSMGGRESLFIGFSRPELFGYIGAVCPAPGLTPVAGSGMHPGQMKEEEMVFENEQPFALLISAAKNDGVVGAYPSNYHNILNQNQTEHLWHVMSSTGHDHTSVTPHLYNFMRLIFHDR